MQSPAAVRVQLVKVCHKPNIVMAVHQHNLAGHATLVVLVHCESSSETLDAIT